jgi:hypothetical protein
LCDDEVPVKKCSTNILLHLDGPELPHPAENVELMHNRTPKNVKNKKY